MKQPWFGDSIVLVGASYLGYVQWAVADSLPPEVKAIIPNVAEAALTLEFLRPDGLSLETPFGWGVMMDRQEQRGAIPRYARNPGTGEPRATATSLLAAAQQVHHDPERPSAIILPVRQAL